MWVTDMAVAAMLMPLARAILEEEGVKTFKEQLREGPFNFYRLGTDNRRNRNAGRVQS